MTYTLLIYASNPTQEAEDAINATIQKHKAIQAEVIARGELVSVAQLSPHVGTKVVEKRDGALLTDGPYIETKEWLVGFYLLSCEEERAISLAEQLCMDGFRIEVRVVSWYKGRE